jgi:hypothetical protein
MACGADPEDSRNLKTAVTGDRLGLGLGANERRRSTCQKTYERMTKLSERHLPLRLLEEQKSIIRYHRGEGGTVCPVAER